MLISEHANIVGFIVRVITELTETYIRDVLVSRSTGDSYSFSLHNTIQRAFPYFLQSAVSKLARTEFRQK